MQTTAATFGYTGHSGVETHLWSCPAGFQCSRSGRSKGQRLTDLSGWRLHKYRLADVCGRQARAASCTARPKQWVGLSWGRLEVSVKQYRYDLQVKKDGWHGLIYIMKRGTASCTSLEVVFSSYSTSNPQWPGPAAEGSQLPVTRLTTRDLFLHRNTHTNTHWLW